MKSDPDETLVTVVDVRMRFWSMVWFMVKAAIAFIPALIILTGIIVAILGMFGLLARAAIPDLLVF